MYNTLTDKNKYSVKMRLNASLLNTYKKAMLILKFWQTSSIVTGLLIEHSLIVVLRTFGISATK